MQQILMLEKEVSQLLVDGLVGRNFAAPLSFYLARKRGISASDEGRVPAAAAAEVAAAIRFHCAGQLSRPPSEASAM